MDLICSKMLLRLVVVVQATQWQIEHSPSPKTLLTPHHFSWCWQTLVPPKPLSLQHSPPGIILSYQRQWRAPVPSLNPALLPPPPHPDGQRKTACSAIWMPEATMWWRCIQQASEFSPMPPDSVGNDLCEGGQWWRWRSNLWGPCWAVWLRWSVGEKPPKYRQQWGRHVWSCLQAVEGIAKNTNLCSSSDVAFNCNW